MSKSPRAYLGLSCRKSWFLDAQRKSNKQRFDEPLVRQLLSLVSVGFCLDLDEHPEKRRPLILDVECTYNRGLDGRPQL